MQDGIGPAFPPAARRIMMSAANAAFFDLLQGLVCSVRDKPQGLDIPMAVLDVGLEPQQVAWLESKNVRAVRPERTVFSVDKEVYKAYTSRPLLPEIVPGYDLYMWVDADAWIQDWSAVELYFRGAAEGKLACVMSIDRAYDAPIPTLRLRTFLGFIIGLTGWSYDHYRQAYGRRAALRLALAPMVNSGVFAMRADAPQWQAWQECFRAAGAPKRGHPSDQTALTYAIFERHLAMEYLPAWCNWVCNRARPKVDPDTQLLTEPYLPHHPLGIVHLIYKTKYGEYELEVLGGGRLTRSLRYAPLGPA